MANVTKKPKDLPTGNTMDAPLLEAELDIAYVSFQANGCKIENPPALGDSLTLVVHGKCVESGDKEAKDGEIRPKRVISLTSVHYPGKRPVADKDQGDLFSITSDTEGTRVEQPGDDAGDIDPPDYTENEFNPAFSDGGGPDGE